MGVRVDSLPGVYRGFPTNFSKYGDTNYYHVYHVVALAVLLAEFSMEDAQEQKLRNTMIRWHEVAETVDPGDGLKFADPAKVYKDFAKYHPGLRYETWQALWQSLGLDDK